jgi:hypothetical protein
MDTEPVFVPGDFIPYGFFMSSASLSCVSPYHLNWITDCWFSTRHTQAATPIAEGVYTISSTGRESHLAYHITLPDLGEVQKDIGLNEKGSYIVSAKASSQASSHDSPSTDS